MKRWGYWIHPMKKEKGTLIDGQCVIVPFALLERKQSMLCM